MKKYQIEIKWGILFTLAALVWMVFEKLMGWHNENIDMHPTLTNIFALVAIGIYVFALREKRRVNGGRLSWSEGFKTGLLITVIVTALSPIAQWIIHHWISPDYFSNAIEYAVNSGHASREQAESYFNFNSYLRMAAVGAFVMGLITSAIVAFVVRTK